MVGELIVDVISFQKIYGLCCLKGHTVEKGCHAREQRTDGRTECENRARILETEFAIQ